MEILPLAGCEEYPCHRSLTPTRAMVDGLLLPCVSQRAWHLLVALPQLVLQRLLCFLLDLLVLLVFFVTVSFVSFLAFAEGALVFAVAFLAVVFAVLVSEVSGDVSGCAVTACSFFSFLSLVLVGVAPCSVFFSGVSLIIGYLVSSMDWGCCAAWGWSAPA